MSQRLKALPTLPTPANHAVFGRQVLTLRNQLFICLLVIFGPRFAAFTSADQPYIHGPDSLARDDVPHGKVTQHVWIDSKVYPETKRRYSVYVPAQYDGKQPAALMVFQDGHAFEGTSGDFRVPIVFDNLIAIDP